MAQNEKHSTQDPASDAESAERKLRRVVADIGLYPIDAYLFVNDGVSFTVHKTHGARKSPEQNMHVTGRQLCEGLRELALKNWGLMADVVLKRWNLTSTLDFGRIVFAMVENGLMSKTQDDRLDDFRDVYDFGTAFGGSYVITPKA
jgi:uncharacterized repeat protein (TIGR04138 family)